MYESNVASCRIWDALGFKRIGKVPGGGRLLSNPGQYVDAIIYGRDLGPEGEDSFTQDRFDKIRYYLKHSKYPRGADRAEKSRLRSAATHYKLIEGDGDSEKLMLKDKEVVSDPQQQYTIAQEMHNQQHAGINKTTAAIAVQYHWVRIKETVSRVIRDCPQCKETLKLPLTGPFLRGDDPMDAAAAEAKPDPAVDGGTNHHHHHPQQHHHHPAPSAADALGSGPHPLDPTALDAPANQHPFMSTHAAVVPGSVESMSDYTTLPLDPQIMDIHQPLPRFSTHDVMTDAYTHGTHGLSGSHFDDDVRHHTAHDYMLVHDTSETDAGAALHQEALGLVHSQANDVLAKFQYVGPPEDDLDFT